MKETITTDVVLGVLDLTSSGAGFLRSRESSYLPGDLDVYVAPKLVQRYGLRSGDEIAGQAGVPPKRGKNPPLVRVDAVNGQPPDQMSRRPDFQRLSALHPNEQLMLECGLMRRGQPDYTNRVIDLFCPLGKGQRAMIVAPSRAGKTM
ncbi:MAG: transcription termination factor Rho, partial [Longimicrobiales bacterium]